MTDINFIRKISNLNNACQKFNAEKTENTSFKELFKEKVEKAENELIFSKHANERIAERNIELNKEVTDKLKEASVQARDKGLKNVLIMIDNSAFIVSTAQNKIITAVKSNELKENIFTNIDGAVIK